MLSLSLDACGEVCSACVHDGEAGGGGRILSRASESASRRHAERMMAIVESALNEAGADYSDIGAAFAAAGPGSFTGIRIGCASARGIALGLSIRAYGVPVLDAMAKAAKESEADSNLPLMACLRANRNEVYARLFGSDGEPLGDFFRATPKEAACSILRVGLNEAVLCGSGSDCVAEALRLAQPSFESRILHERNGAEIEDIARLGALLGERCPPAEPLYPGPASADPVSPSARVRLA